MSWRMIRGDWIPTNNKLFSFRVRTIYRLKQIGQPKDVLLRHSENNSPKWPLWEKK